MGGGAPDGIIGVMDISFTSPASQRNVTRSARLERLPEESALSWTRRQLRCMTAVREDEKRRKYRGVFRAPFTPVVFTAGGFLGRQAESWLKRLSVYALGKSAPAFDLSVALVRARTASLR
jgi:hypothetical protein